ncbi:MAG: Cof-type HAD-IIB family hydrolase [Microbacterium sp.]|jgi:Cof subfamily protein (haloacid dehalogenase superfamily)|uniref:HAD family hydrolase n=1 Tax=Microbacterium sp. TaxID=51671 RepID=UPI002824F58A|nr:HAD family hydrolase [Microbacterium sp.]MDR2320631.1 Cof-type HAD-IIB family hydrolase [Microbacterium sp.]
MSTVADPAGTAPSGSLSALRQAQGPAEDDRTPGSSSEDAEGDRTPGTLSEDAEGARDETAPPTSSSGSRIRLIATDLDGTLLDPAGRVSARTRAALDAARAAGIAVVPVTARQPIGLRAIAAEAGFEGWALCGNGAYGIHLDTHEPLFATEIAVPVQQRIAHELGTRIEGLLFASVREAGEVFVAQAGYAEVATHGDHKRDPASMGAVPLAEVLAAPSLKLVIRHATIAPAEIFDALGALDQSGFEATLSGAPFVEVMAEGVTKATGLAQLCDRLGIDRSEVLAFGDALNDVEMLRWAGRGVAMANAEPEALAAADEVAPSNAEDGVAVMIERVLAG